MKNNNNGNNGKSDKSPLATSPLSIKIVIKWLAEVVTNGLIYTSGIFLFFSILVASVLSIFYKFIVLTILKCTGSKIRPISLGADACWANESLNSPSTIVIALKCKRKLGKSKSNLLDTVTRAFAGVLDYRTNLVENNNGKSGAVDGKSGNVVAGEAGGGSDYYYFPYRKLRWIVCEKFFLYSFQEDSDFDIRKQIVDQKIGPADLDEQMKRVCEHYLGHGMMQDKQPQWRVHLLQCSTNEDEIGSGISTSTDNISSSNLSHCGSPSITPPSPATPSSYSTQIDNYSALSESKNSTNSTDPNDTDCAENQIMSSCTSCDSYSSNPSRNSDEFGKYDDRNNPSGIDPSIPPTKTNDSKNSHDPSNVIISSSSDPSNQTTSLSISSTQNSAKEEEYYGVVLALHHAYGDGLSWLQMLRYALAENDPQPIIDPLKRSPSSNSEEDSSSSGLYEQLKPYLLTPHHFASQLIFIWKEFNSFHGPFVKKVKTLQWTSNIKLDSIKSIRKSDGVKPSFTAVILSCASKAFSQLFTEFRCKTKVPSEIFAISPYAKLPYKNLKPTNRFYPCFSPIIINDHLQPLERLEVCDLTNLTNFSRYVKKSNLIVANLCGNMISPLQKLIRYSARATVAFTNVPGTKTSIRLFKGDEVVEIYLIPPVKFRTGIVVGIFGYCGRLSVSVCVDEVLESKGEFAYKFLKAFQNQLNELCCTDHV